ncbi:MAG: metallophosphoesterase family protein [Myxococcales bacterium]|nr:metallophosphoesterase family protein [Myxococcales bacterium]MCB9521006.1 metallophosphoesterase family protein [Myxococcales bacterium]MCB9531667.1 metallophosphoesterase family protein [Myxococcales bacterium]
MRIAIFSDVHSNIDALEVVLRRYEELAIDKYVCLGDVVGYGGAPQECCELVRNLVEVCILGNHDAAVCGRMDYAYYYEAARNALDHHASLVSATNLEWLRSLPYMDRREGWTYSHGSPVNVEAFDYVFNFQQATALLLHWGELRPVTFIGHSHLTKAFALAPPGTNGPRIEEVFGPLITFDPARRYIVTVGSVGQPRDNDARACFTVFDTEAMTLEYHRADYDILKAAQRIFDCKRLVPDFGKRLFLGI